MYLFAHTGIALGIAEVVTRARCAKVGLKEEQGSRCVPSLGRAGAAMVLLGSLAPDAIDKPLGALFFGGLFASGRTAGHTLLFALVVLLAGAGIWIWRRKLWGLTVLYGVVLHYVMDEIWLKPSTFWWPLLGWGFADTQPDQLSDWFGGWLQELLYAPKYFVPEIIGFLVVVWFLITHILVRTANKSSERVNQETPGP